MGPPGPVPLAGQPALTFRPVPATDVALAAALEARSYPADEAATPEKLEYRQRVAPELFYGVYHGDQLVGFVVSTASKGDALEEEAMSVHEPGGPSICIHSVVVDASWRRRGVARAMVRAYVDAIAADTERCGAARRMLLLAHAPLLGLYAQCGFEFLGPSAVVHGSELWFDMRLDLAVRRELDFVQVDAFTPLAMAGNPAAVLFTQRGGDEEWMQGVAMENNLSATAFLERRHASGVADGEAWDIRWFTPGGEIALCGHATLGSAHALWDTGRVPTGKPISFHTRQAGVLLCVPADNSWIRMDFPSQPPRLADGDAPRAALAAALGLREADVLHLAQGPDTQPDWLVEVPAGLLEGLAPDMSALARVRPMERDVIVTSAGGTSPGTGALAGRRPRVLQATGAEGGTFDFESRVFYANMGSNEDPATGSAHCILAPYWAAKLGKPDGAVMTALQASPRGGLLRVRLRSAGGDSGGARVDIEGQAITVLRGRMAV